MIVLPVLCAAILVIGVAAFATYLVTKPRLPRVQRELAAVAKRQARAREAKRDADYLLVSYGDDLKAGDVEDLRQQIAHAEGVIEECRIKMGELQAERAKIRFKKID